MGRRMEAPIGHECPYRYSCPHLDHLSTSWVMEVYQEAFELRQQLHDLEQRSGQRIEELEKALLERDATIAQLRLQHQKQFKGNKPRGDSTNSSQEGSGQGNSTPQKVKARRRGAPVGHPGWHRREPDHIDQVVQVPAPGACPHCQCTDLQPSSELHEHVQEDIVLVPRTHVTQFVHRQCFCPNCRREVYQKAEGELPRCSIGPVTRALAIHLRYNLQIPYRKVRHILADLFGMPLVPASAMAFDRKATALGKPLYEQLRVLLQNSATAYADETSWRQDGQGHFVWFGGNDDVAVYQITDNRSADSAVQLLGEDFDGTLVTDAYAAYNAVNPRHWQTCWGHIAVRCKELLQQIQLTDPPIKVPRSVEFCGKLKQFAARLCAMGRRMRGRKLSLSRARAMIPSLRRQFQRIAGKTLDYPPAETLRDRLVNKDRDKLFTFLRIKGIDPTNNHSERSVRFLVIMRKICFGTRSAAGSESHSVLPSLLQTARRQGRDPIGFLRALMTRPLDGARAALWARPP